MIIYIGAPYMGHTREDIVSNLHRAQKAIKQVYALGAMGIYTPLMTDGFSGVFPETEMLKRDLWLLARCDAVLLLSGWQESVGACRERQEAVSLQIPVFDSVEFLNAWLNAPSKSVQRRLASQLGEGE